MVSGASGPAVAQDSDGWSQFQGGPDHRGVRSDAPEPPYRTRWTFRPSEGGGLSGAVIVGNLAVTVGDEAVYAIDLSSGEAAWDLPRAGGPLSTPAIATGKRTTLLYVEGPDELVEASPTASPTSPTTPPTSAEDDGQAGDGSALVAVDLEDRSERWRVPLGAESRSGVTVDGDTAYVGDEDGIVHAVAIGDGRVRWTADLAEGVEGGDEEDPGCRAFDGAAVDVPIAVADGTVIVVGRDVDGGAAAVSALAGSSGECTWRMFPQIGSAAVSAAAAGEGIVVIGSADRFVRGLGAEDGRERWSALSLSLFSPLSAPAYAPGVVYVADLGGGLYRLDASDGARAWSHQLNEVVLGSPVLSGGTVLVGLLDGRLAALDAETGHLVWQTPPSRGRLVSIALAPDAVVVQKGRLDGALVAFEHDAEGRLVDVPSPTDIDLPTTLSRAGIAALVVLAALAGPGLLLRRRFGDRLADLGAEGEITDDVDDADEEPAP